MSTRLRRCLVMSPLGRIVTGDLTRFENAADIEATASRWVRIWARWPRVQPTSTSPIDLAELRAQIAKARTLLGGTCKVVLTAYEFPRWANGTGNVDEPTYQYWDRYRNATDYANRARRKALEWGVPSALGVNDPYGKWIDALYSAFRPGGSSGTYVDVLEIVNEPNKMLWPQQGSAGTPGTGAEWGTGQLQIDCSVFQMMQTAQEIARRYGSTIWLGAPALHDTTASSRYDTPYTTTIDGLFARFSNATWTPDPMWVWTHHAYNDVQNGYLRTADTRSRISAKGWPGKRALVGSGPAVFVTEAGMTMDAVRQKYPNALPSEWQNLQALDVASAYSRYNNDTAGQGAGIDLWAQYLNYTDTEFDSGMREALTFDASGNVVGGGGLRQLYATWRDLPSPS
jgi:hypothetical protein